MSRKLTFGEFMLALPSPCASFVLDVKGSRRASGAFFDFGHEFAFFIVDPASGWFGRALWFPEAFPHSNGTAPGSAWWLTASPLS